jgi:hypothetical protein
LVPPRSRHQLVGIVVVAVVLAVDVVEPTVPACPLTITYPSLCERRLVDIIGEKPVAEVEVLYLYPMLTRCRGINDVLVLAWEGETIEWSEDAYPYTLAVADEDTVLEEAMDNLKEAGGRIRATQSLMRSEGMTDGENHRDLLTRLSTALAMTEAAYLEARRRRDL